LDKSLVIIPNKTVAAEAVTNLARFTQRRVEQVIGLTYGTPAAKMEEIVAEIRRIIESKPEINVPDTHVYFRDYSASSMDIWVVYVFKSPDFVRHMQVRQQINLEIMHAVESRGLSFAFPTQTVHVASLPAAPAGPAVAPKA
ncbi:MAG TPA: mechanosensitive ion channel family protein, partial [Acidobacteriota bacterium]|nr:mechanosensitive ion channel family protein [Acidobacteriota bacterium]